MERRGWRSRLGFVRWSGCRYLCPVTRRRPLALAAVSAALALVALAPAALAADPLPEANEHCAHYHGDPPAGYEGPLLVGVNCRYGDGSGAELSWSAPAGVTEARF